MLSTIMLASLCLRGFGTSLDQARALVHRPAQKEGSAGRKDSGGGSRRKTVPADAPQQPLDLLPRHRLVPQPGGFEGCLLIDEQADAGNLAFLDAHRLEDRAVQWKPAPRGIEVHVEQDEHLIARRQRAVQMNLHRSKYLVEIAKVRSGGLGPAIDAAIGHLPRVVPLKNRRSRTPARRQARLRSMPRSSGARS